MSRFVMYRTATHPDFIANEIAPLLVRFGLPSSLGESVGQYIDATGYTPAAAVAAFDEIIRCYSTEPTKERSE